MKKILVADDSASIRDYLIALLQDQTQARVQPAKDGQEALDLINAGYRPDLALIDLNMPRLDGVQLLAALAKMNFTAPIVIISGLSRQVIGAIEKLSKEYQLNVFGTMGKPIDETAVSHMLDRLHKREKHQNQVVEIKTYEVLDALHKGQVEPWFQPQVELQHRKLVGFEVLCRIRHNTLGVLLPKNFMPTLERSDLIRVVTFELMDKALQQIQALNSIKNDLSLSFNIFAKLFDSENFIDNLIEMINQSSVENHRIILEITETTVANKPLKELEGAVRLAINGCGLSIDDFGSGRATFDRLHSLPFTELKIDQQYLPKHKITEAQRALLESTISMARRLGMKVVVEGVETFHQWELVQHLGCEMAQGYFIAAPMPFDELSHWIENWQRIT